MQWAELDLDAGVWHIAGENFKNGKPQTVHLPAETVAILRRRKDTTNGEYVFPGRSSGHVSFIYKAWKRICKRANLQGVRPHDLRRTLGSWQAATGASLPIIGKTLGHLNQSTTTIYARLNIDPVRQAVDAAVAAMMQAAKSDDAEADE
jgi:integrase